MSNELSDRPAWWQWPTVLSLDAPIVSVLWQALVARAVAARLDWPHVFVLGTSVWLAYAADRWIEGFRIDERVVRTQRHRFYLRQRWPVAAAWLLVFALDLMVGLTMLSPREIVTGLALVVPMLTYLLSHQFIHRHRRWRVPKEICVAALLTGGVGLFAIWSPDAHRLPVLLTVFALLCFTNCALISAWERHVDAAHDQSSLARSPHGTEWIRTMPYVTAAAAAGLTLAATSVTARHVGACAMASALLLALIDRDEVRRGWQIARVLADAALLTPIVPLVWLA